MLRRQDGGRVGGRNQHHVSERMGAVRFLQLVIQPWLREMRTPEEKDVIQLFYGKPLWLRNRAAQPSCTSVDCQAERNVSRKEPLEHLEAPVSSRQIIDVDTAQAPRAESLDVAFDCGQSSLQRKFHYKEIITKLCLARRGVAVMILSLQQNSLQQNIR